MYFYKNNMLGTDSFIKGTQTFVYFYILEGFDTKWVKVGTFREKEN